MCVLGHGKLAKAKAKTLKGKKEFLTHLLMKINEKKEKMNVKGHRLHVRRKLKENNRK